jgi:glycosyltransferase involved in cell wall biosynthesis
MITAIVLTKNEARHIERCLRSLSSLATRVLVIDSGSTDETAALARSLGAEFFSNPWINHASQFNWGLDNCSIETPWVLRIDADEYLMAGTKEILHSALMGGSLANVSGVTLNRRIYFQGRWIRHGGVYPRRMLRLFRFRQGRCEQRWMDEHIRVDGDVAHIEADFADDNLNGLSWWTTKHNGYATREVADLLLPRVEVTVLQTSAQARAIRWAKYTLYSSLPLGVRPALYFFYRYILRGGFIDGWQGAVFHVLQGFWYRFLVDAKLSETREFMRREGVDAKSALQRLHDLNVLDDKAGAGHQS